MRCSYRRIADEPGAPAGGVVLEKERGRDFVAAANKAVRAA
jgi:hypothetical protein